MTIQRRCYLLDILTLLFALRRSDIKFWSPLACDDIVSNYVSDLTTPVAAWVFLQGRVTNQGDDGDDNKPATTGRFALFCVGCAVMLLCLLFAWDRSLCVALRGVVAIFMAESKRSIWHHEDISDTLKFIYVFYTVRSRLCLTLAYFFQQYWILRNFTVEHWTINESNRTP